jgi:hypothetical protein
MDSGNFLNIEYLLLRLQYLFTNLFSFVTGTPVDPASGTVHTKDAVSNILSNISFTAGQLTIAGMALSVILLFMSLYVRIKLELYEHEEFHKRDAKYHKHDDAHGADTHAEQQDGPKNSRWEEVRRLGSSANESDWRRAIMEADIILANMLEAQGYRGQSIGDKLKDANPLQFTTLDLAWKAHKVRNDIAHAGEGYHLSERDTAATLDFYRRVFEEFNFI